MLKPVNPSDLVVGEIYIVDIDGVGCRGVYLGKELGHYCFQVRGLHVTMVESQLSSSVYQTIYE